MHTFFKRIKCVSCENAYKMPAYNSKMCAFSQSVWWQALMVRKK